MTNYGRIHSTARPQEIVITNSSVFVASDIQPYTRDIEEYHEEGYEYNYVGYTKDEYLIQQNQKITSLEEELKAAKILLGVD